MSALKVGAAVTGTTFVVYFLSGLICATVDWWPICAVAATALWALLAVIALWIAIFGWWMLVRSGLRSVKQSGGPSWPVAALPISLLEHRFVVVAAVPLPHPLVEVGAKPALRHGVMRSAKVGLKVAEEPFDGVRVDVAADVNALTVLDAAERVTALTLQSVVAAPIVRERERCGQDELAELPLDRARRLSCVREAPTTSARMWPLRSTAANDLAVLRCRPLIGTSLAPQPTRSPS
jgi:hypothetical protein